MDNAGAKRGAGWGHGRSPHDVGSECHQQNNDFIFLQCLDSIAIYSDLPYPLHCPTSVPVLSMMYRRLTYQLACTMSFLICSHIIHKNCHYNSLLLKCSYSTETTCVLRPQVNIL